MPRGSSRCSHSSRLARGGGSSLCWGIGGLRSGRGVRPAAGRGTAAAFLVTRPSYMTWTSDQERAPSIRIPVTCVNGSAGPNRTTARATLGQATCSPARPRRRVEPSPRELQMAYLPAEERRRSIIDAAVVVIASHGLSGATTRRIAEQAEAPLGALHYCFRNKAELIDLVAERGATMLREAFDGVDPTRGLEATIRDSVSAYWQWVQANLGLQLALLELGMWRIRQAGEDENVYSMYDAFGTDLLKRNLELAV